MKIIALAGLLAGCAAPPGPATNASTARSAPVGVYRSAPGIAAAVPAGSQRCVPLPSGIGATCQPL